MEQQFSLSWNNFHGNLSKGFAGLLGKAEFVDVTIAVDGHLLQAHKVILSICSPYFKKMFQLNPCQHPIVVLRDVSHKAMKDLLQFMYHGEVSVKREDLTSFIGTAEVLQIKGLTNKETEEDEGEQELPKQIDHLQNNNVTNTQTRLSESTDTVYENEVAQNHQEELLKQKHFIERLQRLSNLKRKSDEYLQSSYSYNSATDNLNSTEKRPKFREKPNKHSVHSNASQVLRRESYDNAQNIYDDVPTDMSSNYSSAGDPLLNQKFNNSNQDYSDNGADMSLPIDTTTELKTECDDSDIIVTDPAMNPSSKSYDNSEDLSIQKDVNNRPSAQDGALSLVMNGSCENPQLPVRYKYIYSRKGHKQLVHMNFVYTKHSTNHGRTSWRCVQYFSLNRCPATVETVETMICAVNHQHNHENCYEKIAKNNVYEITVDTK